MDINKFRKLLKVLLTIIEVTILLFIIFAIFANVIGGTKKYKSSNSGIMLNIPKFSRFKEECCMYSASFESIRTKASLKKEIEKELEKYEKIYCNDGEFYYNREKDFTVISYDIEDGRLFNKFSIVFDKGNYCEDDGKVKYDFDENYNFENAEESGYVVYQNGTDEIINYEKLNEFYDNSKNNINGKVTIVRYTIEGDPIIEQLHYLDGEYILFTDNMRDEFSADRSINQRIISSIDVEEFF